MTKSYRDAATDPCCCYNDAGEAAAAAAVPTSSETSTFFADMVADDYSTDDHLFELVWEQAEGQAGGASGSMQPAVSCLWSPKFSSKPSDDVRLFDDPPSEDEMAAWLGTIVKGEELACTRPTADDGRDIVPAPPAMGTSTATGSGKEEKVPTTTTTTTEGLTMMGKNNKEMRKAPVVGGSSSRRSHHGEAHNLTEKRRRHKINERLKILQQLVPGCSKSNQASTLDQTIQYMKSLQHQVQAMSVVAGLAAQAVYPVVQPRCVPTGTTTVAMPFPAAHPMVLGGHPPSSSAMVPIGATMLQLPHYPAAAVMMPLYPAAAAAPTSTPVAPGDALSANRLHGSSSRSRSKRMKGRGSSVCQSD